MLSWSALINVRMARDVTDDAHSCAATTMNLICRDSDFYATHFVECRASFQVRGILLDPRCRKTREQTCIWIRSMVSGVLQRHSSPLSRKDDLSVLLPRQMQCHLQIRTSRSWTGDHRARDRLHSVVPAARSCCVFPLFPNQRLCYTPARWFTEIVEEWIVPNVLVPF